MIRCIPNKSFIQKIGMKPARVLSLTVLSLLLITNAIAQCTNYVVTLESRTYNGTQTTFVFSVYNPTPGNGKDNGTTQDLSHWDMILNNCVNTNDIVSVGTSSNGTGWSNGSVEYHSDKSQDCYTGDVLKFDRGTNDMAKTYYRVVLNGNYGTAPTTAVFKSGANTGCCTKQITGIGCRVTCNSTITANVTINNSQYSVNRTVALSVTPSGGTAPYTYSWSATPGVTLSSTAGQNIIATYAAGTTNVTYTLVVTDANGCTTTVTRAFSQIQLCDGVGAPTGVNVARCGPGSVTLTATGCAGGTLNWYTDQAGGTAIATGSSYVTGNLSANTTYYVSCSVGVCESVRTPVTAIINNAPTIYALTGGSYCAGGAGVAIQMAGSQIGVSYQLMLNGANVGAASAGTGAAISFPAQTAAGTYTVMATGTGGCTATIGTAVISVTPAPVVTATAASVCAGSSITLVGSPAGGTWSGTGVSGNTFNAANLAAGPYTVTYTVTANGCTASANTTITVNAVPNTYTLTGGSYCAGGAGVVIGMSGSQTGVSYQLRLNGANVGAAVAGTGAAISFPAQTAAGTYSVVASNGNCTSTFGAAVVSVNPIPVVTAQAASVCVGNSITLTGTPAGGTWTGTGVSGSTFNASGLAAGPYTVTYTVTSNGCTASANAIITVNAAPNTYTLTGGAYCAGGAGVAIAISGSQTGVTYQLMRDGTNVGAAVSGTGAAISFPAQTAAGTYTVMASNGNCSVTFGSAAITITALPTATISYNGPFCIANGGTANVTLTGTQGGTFTSSPAGLSINGTTGAINIAASAANTYTVTYSFNSGNCASTATATVVITSAPGAPTVQNAVRCGPGPITLNASGCTGGTLRWYSNASGGAPIATGATYTIDNITASATYYVSCYNGVCESPRTPVLATVLTPPATFVLNGGTICEGAAGINLTLSGSQVGVSYQLMLNGSNIGSPVTGTGAAISFGIQTAAGTYSVTAVNTAECSITAPCNSTFGSAIIIVLPRPTAFTLTGGTYCAGGAGVPITMSGSQTGVSYQLMLNGSPIGAPIAGTGAAISFPNQTTAGTYTVMATSTGGCTNTFGSAVVAITQLPVVTAQAASVCVGGTVNLVGTPAGGTWTGTGVSGTTFNATGLAAGPYTVTYTVTANGCTASATATITVNAIPEVRTLTGGAYCAGGNGVAITLASSQTGVSYQLRLNGANVGAPINGNGGTITFPLQTTAGTYSVIATNGNGCTNSFGAAVISVTPLPNVTAQSATVCAGGSVTLVGTPAGGTWTGTGVTGNTFNSAGLNVGPYTLTYTVTSNGCTASAVATITVNAVPNTYAVTGGTYCAGGAGIVISTAGSQTGVNYQLMLNGANVGAAVAGTGAAISFPAQTTAGSYMIMATNASTGCTSTFGPAVIAVTPLPVVTAQAASVCIGNTVTLVGSPAGGTWSGTGVSGNTFNAANLAAGPYTVTYTVSANGCTASANATITVNALPATITLNGGSYCAGGAGVVITTSGSQAGTSYQLMLNGTNVGAAVAGTGAAISFPAQTTAGNYMVMATTGNGCSATFGPAAITITPLPVVTAQAATICVGGTVNLVGSPAGGTWSGTGVSGSTFNSANLAAGPYTVTYTVTANGCTASATATITVVALPTAFNLIGGAYCVGGNGVVITLSGSQAGVSYQLRLNGANVGAPVAGTGAAISFPAQTTAGTYSVIATNGNSCTNSFGSAVITVNPAPLTFALTGGTYCAGGAGVPIVMAGSQTGVSYQLMLNGSNVGAAVTGTGAAISFPNQTTAGTYTVMATTTNGCTATFGAAVVVITPLPVVTAQAASVCIGNTVALVGTPAGGTWSGTGVSGSTFNAAGLAAGPYTVTYTVTANGCTASATATITVNALPATVTVTGGSYCAGGSGVAIALSTSQSGVSYQLMLNGAAVGSPIAGTGSAISFPAQTTAGTYSVMATNGNGCTNTFGAAVISVNPLPLAFNLTGGAYCVGGNGVAIVMSGSQVGVSYQLRLNGANVGAAVNGTGNAITFPAQTTAGTYSVIATSGAGCTAAFGAAVITVNPLPTTFTLTGGSYCQGGTGVAIVMSGSQAGVTYQLMLNGANVGAAITGTGNAITFPAQTAAGTYSVMATNANGCSVTFGAAVISIITLPPCSITGPTTVCVGTSNTYTAAAGQCISYQWSLISGNCTITSPSNSASINVTATGAGTYVLQVVMNMNGITSTCQITVTANALPVVTAQNLTVCAGSSIALVGSPAGGTWSGTGVSGNTFNSAGLAAGNYPVTYTVTSNGCTASASAIITVAALPTALTLNGGAYCAGGSGFAITMPNSQNGVSYQLLLGGSNVGAPIIGNGGTITFPAQTTAGTYSVRATNAAGCNITFGAAVITITPLPVVTAQNAAVCVGFSVTLSGSPAGGVWATVNPAFQSAISGNTFNATGLEAGAYPVTYTVTSNGCSATASATVTVSKVPAVFGLALSAGNSGGVKLVSSEKGVTYQLYRDGVAVGSPVKGTGDVIAFSTTQAGEYYTSATSEAGCTVTSGRTTVGTAGGIRTVFNGSLTVNAFPNPYSDRVRFVIESDFSGNGQLDIFNTAGVKLQTVYKGFIRSHLSQSIDYIVPASMRSNLVYVFSVDGHTSSGKLINIR